MMTSLSDWRCIPTIEKIYIYWDLIRHVGRSRGGFDSIYEDFKYEIRNEGDTIA